jgi:hypothetical protein
VYLQEGDKNTCVLKILANNACKELQYIHAQQTHRLLQTNWEGHKHSKTLYREHYTEDMTKSPMDVGDEDTYGSSTMTYCSSYL